MGGATTATNGTGAKKITGIGTLSATFETNLVSPKDSIEYDITVTNSGTIDAKLDKITPTDLVTKNGDVIFTRSEVGFKVGDVLKAGESKTLTVKVEYDDVTSQPESTTESFTVTLDYVQADGSGTVTPGGETAADKLIATETTSGDGLYADEYETGRYIYKGANPSNYITFNDETWRIMSVENDGTLKIIRNESIGNRAWDTTGGTYGSNDWTRPADLNTYLNNDYYNSLTSESQNLIQTHTWGVGPVTMSNTDLAAQIQSENGTTWNGNIGLMTLSEFFRANTNASKCGSYGLNNSNDSICKTTNYMVSLVPSSGCVWTISSRATSSNNVFFVINDSYVNSYGAMYENYNVLPALYLKSGITLEGEGTSSNPYTIVS